MNPLIPRFEGDLDLARVPDDFGGRSEARRRVLRAVPVREPRRVLLLPVAVDSHGHPAEVRRERAATHPGRSAELIGPGDSVYTAGAVRSTRPAISMARSAEANPM